MFSVTLYTLYLVGFKKQAVDLAVKWHATLPMESKQSKAGGAFIAWQKKYPLCEHCTWPVYSNDPHDYCDEQLRLIEDDEANWQQFVEDEEAKMAQQRLDDEEWERAQAEHDAYLASRCAEYSCWEEAGPSGFCVNHERDSIEDDYDDRDDDICDGICGQPAYACTCAETESFRRHQSDPATAGSWWVA